MATLARLSGAWTARWEVHAVVLGGGEEGLNKAQEMGNCSHSWKWNLLTGRLDVGESKRLGGQRCSLGCLVH